MSFLVSKPRVVSLPAVPAIADTTADKAAEEARERERRRRGVLATQLTGGQGVTGPAPVVRKTLLGE